MDQPRRLEVLIDDRERGSSAANALLAHPNAACTFGRLRVGDYVVDGQLLVERKRVPDLLASIEDGRLFRQARRLAASRMRALLILEGTTADLAHRRFSRDAIQGALVTVTLLWGLPILRAADGAETARLMLLAADQLGRASRGFLTRPGRRFGSKRALQSHILQGLPGVGPRLATRLLDRFGSVLATLNAGEELLDEVDGLGPKRIQRIRWAVREPEGPRYREELQTRR